MHELSIAENLLEIVQAQLIAHGIDDTDPAPVAAVRVRLGVLGSVVPAALRSAFAAVIHGTPFSAARLEIEMVSAAIWCPHCRREQTLPDPRRLRCPDCGQPTPDLRHGLELEVASIELTEASHAANP